MNVAWNVHDLPASIVAQQGRSVRTSRAYNEAHEEFRIAVETAAWEGSGGIPARPWERVALTVGCFVGAQQNDGKYRPETTNRLHDALDPIYRALINIGLIADMEAVPVIKTALVRDAEHEGFRIEVEELPTRAEGPPSPSRPPLPPLSLQGANK